MTDENKVVPIAKWRPLRTNEAQELVRERANDTSKVTIGDHAFDRVEQRTITQVDVYTILRKGFITTAPVRSEHGDGWKVIVEKRMPGKREAAVVTVIIDPPSDELFVITVMWVD